LYLTTDILFLEVFYLPGALTWLTVCGVHNGY